jgi:hypothetical protein
VRAVRRSLLMETPMKFAIARLPIVMAVTGMAIAAIPAMASTHGAVQKTKLSMTQARQIAIKAFPGGKIVKAELEHEGGGSGLRYSFDMRHGKAWREVGVDAMTGKILENKAEGANPKD